MQLIGSADGMAFAGANRWWLEQQEVVNGLIIGIGQRAGSSLDSDPASPYLAAVWEDELPLLAAVMTPPHRLLLAAAGAVDAIALEMVARDLMGGARRVPGVNGPEPISAAFAAAWARLSGQTYRLFRRLRVYELRQVPQPAGSSGQMRPAGRDDLDLVVAWAEAFEQEAIGQREMEDPADILSGRIAAGQIFLWQDGEPVSLAARARPSAHGITVNLVYTPPERRGRGYATSLVAALSRQLLEEGYQFCTLFTDLANPTSNSIYQRIGYTPVADFQEYTFACSVD